MDDQVVCTLDCTLNNLSLKIFVMFGTDGLLNNRFYLGDFFYMYGERVSYFFFASC